MTDQINSAPPAAPSPLAVPWAPQQAAPTPQHIGGQHIGGQPQAVPMPMAPNPAPQYQAAPNQPVPSQPVTHGVQNHAIPNQGAPMSHPAQMQAPLQAPAPSAIPQATPYVPQAPAHTAPAQAASAQAAPAQAVQIHQQGHAYQQGQPAPQQYQGQAPAQARPHQPMQAVPNQPQMAAYQPQAGQPPQMQMAPNLANPNMPPHPGLNQGLEMVAETETKSKSLFASLLKRKPKAPKVPKVNAEMPIPAPSGSLFTKNFVVGLGTGLIVGASLVFVLFGQSKPEQAQAYTASAERVEPSTLSPEAVNGEAFVDLALAEDAQ